MGMKTCVQCGVDCSGRKRVKDAAGHYMCSECFGSRTGAASGRAEAAASEQAPENDLDSIPEVEPLALAPDWQQPTLDHCPACSIEVRPGAVVCVSCGARLSSTQTAVASGLQARQACKKCGYDLSGISSTRCPECNAKNPIAPPDVIERDEHDRWMERQVVWEAYKKPIAAFVIGVAIMLVLASGWYGTQGVAFWLVALPCAWIVGSIGYFIVGFLMGFLDTTLPITLSQTAAITAVGLAVAELCFPYDAGMVRIGIRPLLLVGGVITLTTVGVVDDDDKVNCFVASLPITLSCLAVPFVLLGIVSAP